VAPLAGPANTLRDSAPYTHAALHACPKTPTHFPCKSTHSQEFSGAALSNKIESKITTIPDIVQQITQQQGNLGKAPVEAASPTAGGANTAGIIAGTVVGFGVAFGLVVLGVVLLHKKRRAAAEAAAGKAAGDRYAVNDAGETQADGATNGAGPVAEGSESSQAQSFYQRRTLRAQAALQQHASPDGTAKSK
jgi:hypothetical protein